MQNSFKEIMDNFKTLNQRFKKEVNELKGKVDEEKIKEAMGKLNVADDLIEKSTTFADVDEVYKFLKDNKIG